MTDKKAIRFNTKEALKKAKADRDKPVEPVNYIVVSGVETDEDHVCSYDESGFCEDLHCNAHGDAHVKTNLINFVDHGADTSISISPMQPKGTGQITLQKNTSMSKEREALKLALSTLANARDWIGNAPEGRWDEDEMYDELCNMVKFVSEALAEAAHGIKGDA